MDDVQDIECISSSNEEKQGIDEKYGRYGQEEMNPKTIGCPKKCN